VSAKLRGTSYLNEMTRAATEIGYHAGKSFDNLARNPLLAGTGVFFPASFGGTGTSRATVAGTDVLTADAIRLARTELLNNSAIRYGDGYYRAFIAPTCPTTSPPKPVRTRGVSRVCRPVPPNTRDSSGLKMP
jgi:N4-gp56 family major capsid protein